MYAQELTPGQVCHGKLLDTVDEPSLCPPKPRSKPWLLSAYIGYGAGSASLCSKPQLPDHVTTAEP